MEILEVLRRSELFSELDDEQLKDLEQLCHPLTYRTGAVITKQDTPAEKVYIIAEGAAAIILEVSPLAQRQVQAARQYDVIGWSALINPYIFTATTKALETTEVLAFDARKLVKFFMSQPEIGYKVYTGIAATVANRLSNAYSQLLGLAPRE